MARFDIGISSYSDGTPTSPRGKMQTVTSEYVAQQVRSAAVEFDRDVLRNNGEHLTPNEGVRELDRQWDLFNLMLYHGGALAATPGYSTHGPQIGTAIDFGITRADGTNRALTAAEWPKLYAILARRGIVHTGAGFRVYEAWHCNGGYPASLPPITGAPLMGATVTTTPGTDKPRPITRGIRMWEITDGTSWMLVLADGRTFKYRDIHVRAGVDFEGSQVRALFKRLIDATPGNPPKPFTKYEVLAIRYVLFNAELTL